MNTEIMKYGTVCVYCLDLQTRPSCCSENHFEEAYEDSDGNLILESEVRPWMEEVDEFSKDEDDEGPFGGDYQHDCKKDDEL